MACKLCARMWTRLWSRSDAWDRACSNDAELWRDAPEEVCALLDRAEAVRDADPAEAFRLTLEAAETGFAFALESVGISYWSGNGVAAHLDLAAEYLRRAIAAGSWMATISYARLMAEQGHHDICETVLKDGVACDFVPSFFWLAWQRCQRCGCRTVAREIRPLLEHAAGKGHPMAAIELTRMKLLGRFGLRHIPAGIAGMFRIDWGAGEGSASRDEAAHEKTEPATVGGTP